MFTNLEDCAPCHEDTQELDLAPLQVLPKLSHLILRGCYQQLHHLVGLTQLECYDAQISAVHRLAPGLQDLTIQDSSLSAFMLMLCQPAQL